ncbi:hypothetical protein F5B21DRAFT_302858 [Xylaria acuta]|nr:hypothetical protein F5B21DRAFT_302858 [Xylaria acuta]
MVDTLDPGDLFFFDNPGFKSIGIWRNEVNTSSIYCACSARCRRPKSSDPRENFSTTLGKGAGSLLRGVDKLAKTLNQLLWEDDTFPPPSPEPRPVRIGSINRRIVYPVCPACGFPTDGVVYRQITGDEFGLVRAWGDSPGPVPSAKPLNEGEGKRKALLKKVSQVFRRTKPLDIRRTPSELMDLSDTANATRDALITPKAGPHQRDSGKKMGTEMYSGVVRTGTTDDDGEDGPVTAITDDSRKKPRVGIAESAARLRRARKLLDRGV